MRNWCDVRLCWELIRSQGSSPECCHVENGCAFRWATVSLFIGWSISMSDRFDVHDMKLLNLINLYAENFWCFKSCFFFHFVWSKCHQYYLTQQPVTNWAIYTGLALGWARDLHYLRGRQQCSWVSIRALDLRRREELQAISLSGVVRCWGGEFTRTPIPLQFWRIQTLNLAIAFIVTPRTGLMVQLLGRWCECSNRLQ